MKKAICTFVRYERKYIIDESALRGLLPVLLRHMRLDDYCNNGRGYPIYNIYFDTPEGDVIRHCNSSPYFKEKLRMRSYTLPESDDSIIFLELKKKVGGMGSKRRAVLTLGEAKRFLKDGDVPKTDDAMTLQVLREITEYLKNNPVAPVIHICYDRLALFDKEDPSLRVTIDKNITTRRSGKLVFGRQAEDESLLPNEKFLMEVKTSSAFPMWLSRALCENELYSRGFSKYGKEFVKYTKMKAEQKNA